MSYSYFKLIHLLAVMIFLGNLITGLFWMRLAIKTKDLKTICFTIKSIIKLDNYFTIPGVVIITTAGIFAGVYGHFPLLHTGWILWSIILLSLSGMVFGFIVAPLQKKIYHFTLNKEATNDFDWTAFYKLCVAWDIWGFIALILPLVAFVMMTLKIPQ